MIARRVCDPMLNFSPQAAVNPRDYADRPLPEGARHWSEAQKKAYQKGGRPRRSKYATVHYSNLQLLVEENGIDRLVSRKPPGRAVAIPAPQTSADLTVSLRRVWRLLHRHSTQRLASSSMSDTRLPFPDLPTGTSTPSRARSTCLGLHTSPNRTRQVSHL